MIDNGVRKAEFRRIIDGDTFVCLADLWPKTKPKTMSEAAIRVKGWNAAELSEAEGPYMRDVFETQLRGAKVITVLASGMSFERVVCTVYLDGEHFMGILSRALIQLTRAVRAGTTS